MAEHCRFKGTGWCSESCLRALPNHASRRVPAPNFTVEGSLSFKGFQRHCRRLN